MVCSSRQPRRLGASSSVQRTFRLATALLVLVVLVTLLLGVRNVARAVASTFDVEPPGELRLLFYAAAVTVLVAGPVGRALSRARAG